MVRLLKSESATIIKALKGTKDPALLKILEKIQQDEKRLFYVREPKKIDALLKKGFQARKNIKIRYYSLSSDEVRYREVSIYYFNPSYIIAYCHLRKEIRTFVNKRVVAAALLNKEYSIPKSFKDKDYAKGTW